MIEHKVRYVIDWALLAQWSNAANIIIALFAGVVCFVYWKQFVTMRTALAETRASNEIAEQALVLGRRAWLVIHGVPRISSRGWTFEDVTVENVADMPAVIQRFGTCTVEEPSTSASKNWQYIKSGQVVVRNKPERIDFPDVALPPISLDDPDAYRILDRLTIYCVVEYTDCFERTWTTTSYWRDWTMVEGGTWQLGAGYTTMK